MFKCCHYIYNTNIHKIEVIDKDDNKVDFYVTLFDIDVVNQILNAVC